MEPDLPITSNGACLIFYHLPKTAGGTVKKALAPLYPQTAKFRMAWKDWRGHWDTIARMSDDDRHNLRLIHGHQPYGVHALLEQPSVYLTFLREPVDRCISHHFWTTSRNQAPSETEEGFIALAQKARESFDAGKGALQFCNYANLMTRFLANQVFGEEYPSEQAMLQVAMERLRTMKIGLQCVLDESARRLEAWLGMKLDFPSRDKFNSNRPKVHDLPDDVIDFLQRINDCDDLLYREGLRLFAEQG